MKYLGRTNPERAQDQPLLRLLATNKWLNALKDGPSKDKKREGEKRALEMDLMKFGDSGATIKIWSDLLKKEVWLVPRDSKKKATPKGEPSDAAAEPKFLVNRNPGAHVLKFINTMEELFTGAKIACICNQAGGEAGLTRQLNLINKLTRS